MTDEEKVREEQMRMEYSFLRKEIDDLISLHNTLLTFAVTATLAVITIAASEDILLMYLFPFCIIVPIAGRITFYRIGMVKISTYLEVFLEPYLKGISWEKRVAQFNISYFERKFVYHFRNNELLVLGTVCYFLYLKNYPNIFNLNWDIYTVFKVFSPMSLWGCLAYISVMSQEKLKNVRNDMVSAWKAIETNEKDSKKELKELLKRKKK